MKSELNPKVQAAQDATKASIAAHRKLTAAERKAAEAKRLEREKARAERDILLAKTIVKVRENIPHRGNAERSILGWQLLGQSKNVGEFIVLGRLAGLNNPRGYINTWLARGDIRLD